MVDCDELGNEIAGLSARLNAATHRLLTCIRTFDILEGWHRQGAQSCAHWLSWRVGLDPGAAREKVRVARALGGLPKIDDAFAAGRLSYSKVRAITRIATKENEERVVEIALAATGAQMERICRGFRSATEPEIQAAADRRVRARVLGSGLVKLEIVVSADEADLLLKAMEHARQQLTPPAPAPPEDPHAASDGGAHSLITSAAKAPRPSAADAVVHMASAYLAGDAANPGAAAPDHYQIVVHLDREIDSLAATLSSTLEDGTRVSAEALRRVACDGGVVGAVVDEQGAVLDVGRRTRAIPTAIRRALSLRDKGCRFPGCGNDRFLHGHHIHHWLHGGRTALDNLVLLCSFHHRQIHEGGYSIALTSAGEVEVHAPDGTQLSSTQPTLIADLGFVDWYSDWWGGTDHTFDAWTATPSWDGEAVDYEAVVGALVAE